MAASLNKLLTAVVFLLGLTGAEAFAQTQKRQAVAPPVQQCNLQLWVQGLLARRWDALNALQSGSNAACAVYGDANYCGVSPALKDFIKQQDASYKNILAREAIARQQEPGNCLLCLVKDTYQTVVKNPNSIQKLCADLGRRVESNATLKSYYDNMSCNFFVDQRGLTDTNFGDGFWNIGQNSVRYWLTRSIDDIKAGVPDDLVAREMQAAGSLLQRFVSSYAASQKDQEQLETQFSGINCIPVLPVCTRVPVNCPPGS